MLQVLEDEKISLYKSIIDNNFFNSDHVLSKINNKIIANVGNQIITDLDIEDEIKLCLSLTKKSLAKKI